MTPATPPVSASRRSFLVRSASATAGLAALAAPATQAPAAGETLRVGCIGTGSRGRMLMQTLARVPHVRITAVCDVYDAALAQGRNLADPKALATRHHRELLDRKDIDAVVIATPDHWHVPMTIDACAAGKDVYCEKPLTHSIAEGRAVIAAQKRSGRVVQVGMQQRSMPHIRRARDIVRQGGIGKVHKVHLTWNRNSARAQHVAPPITDKQVDWKAFLGNARPQPLDPYKVSLMWRFFWDFGGGLLTDLMVHWIDVAHWFLDLDHPARALTMGDHFSSKGVWETPDTIQTLLHYPDKEVQVYFEGTYSNARNAAMIEFMGTRGTLYLDRGRYEVYPERDSRPYEEWVLGSGPKGKDYYDKPDGELLHLTNWVECVRSRRQPSAPVEGGVSAAAAAHLGNLAYRQGGVATWPG